MTSKGNNGRFLLLGAMSEEIAAYEQLSQSLPEGKEVIVDLVGVSKPIAAASTQRLISKYRPDVIIFSGVAAALDDSLQIGDIGICTAAIDSDLDVRCWDNTYRRGDVPFTNQRIYRSDPDLAGLARYAADESGIGSFDAYIATGSKFLDAEGKHRFIDEDLPDLEASIGDRLRIPDTYDMESSAVLQVANDNKVPVLVIRAISDTTKGDSPADFNRFIAESVDNYVSIVEYVLRNA